MESRDCELNGHRLRWRGLCVTVLCERWYPVPVLKVLPEPEGQDGSDDAIGIPK